MDFMGGRLVLFFACTLRFFSPGACFFISHYRVGTLGFIKAPPCVLKRSSSALDTCQVHAHEQEVLDDFYFEELKELVDEVKGGAHGSQVLKELQEAEKAVDEQTALHVESNPELAHGDRKPDIRELFGDDDKSIDDQLNKVFDIADIPAVAPESRKKVDYDAFADRFKSNSSPGQVTTEQMQSVVHKIYHSSGLLVEPFKRVDLGPVTLSWTQTMTNVDIWFIADPSDKAENYSVKILPQTITLLKNGVELFSGQLQDKVDCDASFWTMFKHPASASKYVNINLTKRKQKHNVIWDNLFIESQSPSTNKDSDVESQ